MERCTSLQTDDDKALAHLESDTLKPKSWEARESASWVSWLKLALLLGAVATLVIFTRVGDIFHPRKSLLTVIVNSAASTSSFMATLGGKGATPGGRGPAPAVGAADDNKEEVLPPEAAKQEAAQLAAIRAAGQAPGGGGVTAASVLAEVGRANGTLPEEERRMLEGFANFLLGEEFAAKERQLDSDLLRAKEGRAAPGSKGAPGPKGQR